MRKLRLLHRLRVRLDLRSESGISLVMAMGIMLALSITGTSVVAFSASNSRSAEYSADNMASLHLAEAAEAYARSVLWNALDPTDPSAVPGGTVSLEGGTANYSATYDSGTQTWTLTGTGALPNPTGGEQITQTVSSQVQVTASGGAGSQPWAIFVGDTGCDGFSFKLNGGNANIVGGIHSNGDLEINGDDITAGYVSTHGDPCKNVVGGNNVDLGGSSEPVIDTEEIAWPVDLDESDFTCTFSGSSYEFATDGMTIPSGTYCASGLFKIAADNITGQITVVADEILVNGNNVNLEPAPGEDVLFYGTSDKNMVLNGYAYGWDGMIYHEYGRVVINGDEDSTVTGVILALEVEVNGSGFNMQSNGSAGYIGSPDEYTLANVAGSYSLG